MTLEESREIIPLMESMIGQIEEQQNLMAEMILEMQNQGQGASSKDILQLFDKYRLDYQNDFIGVQ